MTQKQMILSIFSMSDEHLMFYSCSCQCWQTQGIDLHFVGAQVLTVIYLSRIPHTQNIFPTSRQHILSHSAIFFFSVAEEFTTKFFAKWKIDPNLSKATE